VEVTARSDTLSMHADFPKAGAAAADTHAIAQNFARKERNIP
jgi:hypothetical protein